MRCSVLQCVAVCCSVLQCVAVCCNALQCVAVCCGVLQCVAVCCSVLQCVAVCCSVLQCVAVCCSLIAHDSTGWHRFIGYLQLQVSFCKRATNRRALLLKMTCKDKASYGSSPPSIVVLVLCCYGVALVNRIDKIIGLFCKRALQKRRYSAKETYNLIDPTDRSHPIPRSASAGCCSVLQCVAVC